MSKFSANELPIVATPNASRRWYGNIYGKLSPLKDSMVRMDAELNKILSTLEVIGLKNNIWITKRNSLDKIATQLMFKAEGWYE